MLRAETHSPAGKWTAEPSATITLDLHQRHRRRIVLTSDDGLEFLLDLSEATMLRHGDGLVLDDGRIVEVRATPEPLLEVRAVDGFQMLRLAWHLGNRHLEAAIEPGRILIRRDHVIADMLTKLGAQVREVMEPFNPEGGAYGGEHTPHHHHDDHNHDHAHGHGHEH